ncbi:bacteriocin [Nostoc sp.]|uniref:bacteriocin n=1 Tax=Nostoc sp. TaxID=1180 RepID=UPI002FF80312
MTENKDPKNPIAQDNTTNELSEKDVASVSGGNFIPPNKTTSFPKTPNGLSEHELGFVSGGNNKDLLGLDKSNSHVLSEHELGTVSGGAAPEASFAIKNKNFIAQNELSEHELNSVSGGGVVTDVLDTTKNLVVDATKTVTDVVKDVI